MKTRITELFDISVPIIQAPMAGVTTPEMAAAVSNAGGLGSLGLAATKPEGVARDIRSTREGTNRAFNVNFFVNRTPVADPDRNRRWLELLKPYFDECGVTPPEDLVETSTSFNDDPDILEALLETRPPIVSFHLGLPDPGKVEPLKAYGAIVIASATTVEEARQVEAAGMHAVVAQGNEAGGHRGTFEKPYQAGEIGTMALVSMIASAVEIPVIAAGGIADGRGIAASLALGAEAAQVGTAFVSCPESSANAAYRAALKSAGSADTQVTQVISGRPARGLNNRFMMEMASKTEELPDFPIAYDAGKALAAAAAMANGSTDFSAFWAGQTASLNREMPAGELLTKLAEETREEISRISKLID